MRIGKPIIKKDVIAINKVSTLDYWVANEKFGNEINKDILNVK